MDAVLPFTSNFRQRRFIHQAHPVYDFLFTYYNLSPAKLEKWHPGFGIVVEVREADQAPEFSENPRYEKTKAGYALKLFSITEREIKQLIWVRSLCKAILAKEPRFACFGMHEWAMVYRTPEIRHQYPLRLSAEAINRFVEETSYCCSHFDAFRFSSPAAKSLNVIQPSAETRLEFEQGGCIHANMDLYKWAYKLSPLISSDFLRECFTLAVTAREIDMRASPYDFSSLGFLPIKVETVEGRAEYVRAQRQIAAAARDLRLALLASVEEILSSLELEAKDNESFVDRPSLARA